MKGKCYLISMEQLRTYVRMALTPKLGNALVSVINLDPIVLEFITEIAYDNKNASVTTDMAKDYLLSLSEGQYRLRWSDDELNDLLTDIRGLIRTHISSGLGLKLNQKHAISLGHVCDDTLELIDHGPADVIELKNKLLRQLEKNAEHGDSFDELLKAAHLA